jgi:hypothetical protein
MSSTLSLSYSILSSISEHLTGSCHLLLWLEKVK